MVIDPCHIPEALTSANQDTRKVHEIGELHDIRKTAGPNWKPSGIAVNVIVVKGNGFESSSVETS